jgi:hypothetical protein
MEILLQITPNNGWDFIHLQVAVDCKSRAVRSFDTLYHDKMGALSNITVQFSSVQEEGTKDTHRENTYRRYYTTENSVPNLHNPKCQIRGMAVLTSGTR